MKSLRIFLFLLLCLAVNFTSSAQGSINSKLKKELEAIHKLDQQYRSFITNESIPKKKADSLAQAFGVTREALPALLWKKQSEIDAANLKKVNEIIQQWGYPGKSLVGSPTNEVAYRVLQHSKELDPYLPAVKLAAEKKELPFTMYAIMQDKVLMQKGKEQLYGTQVYGFSIIDPETGDIEAKIVVWPIKDPETVNERRKAAGFDLRVEENAQRLGVEYVPLTFDDVKNMKESR